MDLVLSVEFHCRVLLDEQLGKTVQSDDKATDEFVVKAVKDAGYVHDLHVTILYLMGLDHERLSGRDFRLTDVSGRVTHNVIA